MENSHTAMVSPSRAESELFGVIVPISDDSIDPTGKPTIPKLKIKLSKPSTCANAMPVASTTSRELGTHDDDDDDDIFIEKEIFKDSGQNSTSSVGSLPTNGNKMNLNPFVTTFGVVSPSLEFRPKSGSDNSRNPSLNSFATGFASATSPSVGYLRQSCPGMSLNPFAISNISSPVGGFLPERSTDNGTNKNLGSSDKAFSTPTSSTNSMTNSESQVGDLSSQMVSRSPPRHSAAGSRPSSERSGSQVASTNPPIAIIAPTLLATENHPQTNAKLSDNKPKEDTSVAAAAAKGGIRLKSILSLLSPNSKQLDENSIAEESYAPPKVKKMKTSKKNPASSSSGILMPLPPHLAQMSDLSHKPIEQQQSPGDAILKQRTSFTKRLSHPASMVVTKAVLAEDSTETDKHYYLPDGWRKRTTQRLSGQSEGKWDAYIYPPKEYKEGKIRSNSDMFRFLAKYPEIEINPRYVNMDRLPEQIESDSDVPSQSTKKLIEFIQKLKSGEEINLDEYLKYPAKEPKTSDPNLNQGEAGNQNMAQDVRAKKARKSSLEVEFKLSPMSLQQGLKLEKIFHENSNIPTDEQLRSWAKELKLKYPAVKKWFAIKWRAKLEYEANSYNPEDENEEDFDEFVTPRCRKLQRFDVTFNSDPMLQIHDGSFNIGIENGDDDEDDFGGFEETEIDIDEVEIPLD